ncbi:MAG: HipA domain-containing protein [Campylobacterales bacterium]|nr:HipA domain-containing protein [Campylobacterales bacterium]
MNREVDAFIFDQKIGTILYDYGIVYFEYDKIFKSSGLEISPLKLPLTLSGVYTNKDDYYFEGLAGVFHDTIPDKFGTKVIEKYYESKGTPPHKLNVIDKLMFIGNKSIGAITFKPSSHTLNSEEVESIIELKEFYENAKKVVEGDSIEVIDEMLNFMDSAASAGGARAKAVIGFNPDNKKMISGVKNDLKKGYQHYILKFDSEKESGKSYTFTKLEYLYMTLAKRCGINIPEIDLIDQGNLTHYLIKRFDRTKQNKRIHLHSVAGLTHSNFNIPGHYSYDSLLRLTRHLTKDQSAIEEQFKRVVFNIIGRNQDDHAKNFSFLMDSGGSWSLSPAYDITYANGEGYTKNHQLSLNGKTNNFNKEDLLELATKHSIKKEDAEIMIERTKHILSSFEEKAKELEIDTELIKIVSKDLRLEI